MNFLWVEDFYNGNSQKPLDSHKTKLFVCGRTMFSGDCLVCKQDKEYHETLEFDKTKFSYFMMENYAYFQLFD